MPKQIKIDPVTRIEGHLAVRVDVEAGKVVNAYSSGEMFRGFEVLLRGRHPMDAQQIVQRICGVCPISHGIASILAQDEAYQVTPPENGRLMRNLVQGANYVQSHIVHFYHLSALDFVDIAAVTQYTGDDPALKGVRAWVEKQVKAEALYPAAPFLPRYEGKYVSDAGANFTAIKNYLEGLDMRALAHQCAAIFCGKIPHATALIPGGMTEIVTADKIASYSAKMQRLQSFIDNCYIPDLFAVAGQFPEYFDMGKGNGAYLSFGVFHESADGSRKLFPAGVIENGALSAFDPSKITEDVKYSYFSSKSGAAPAVGETVADPNKTDAYSWLKAPRYGGKAMEVGALSRVLVAYLSGDTLVKGLVDSVLAKTGKTVADLNSVLGRHVARGLEAKIIAARCLEWVEQLKPGAPSFTDFKLPESAVGAGLTEAPRGALGHWIDIKDHKIANYQCVVPTTWNCSPRDDKGEPGVVELALVGTPIANEAHPIEAARVVRSFDPCIACAVH